jgi:hypothetical protein
MGGGPEDAPPSIDTSYCHDPERDKAKGRHDVIAVPTLQMTLATVADPPITNTEFRPALATFPAVDAANTAAPEPVVHIPCLSHVSAIQEPAENNFKGSGFRSTQLNIRIAKNGMVANGVRTRFPTRSECRHISDQTSPQETPPQSQSKLITLQVKLVLSRVALPPP